MNSSAHVLLPKASFSVSQFVVFHFSGAHHQLTGRSAATSRLEYTGQKITCLSQNSFSEEQSNIHGSFPHYYLLNMANHHFFTLLSKQSKHNFWHQMRIRFSLAWLSNVRCFPRVSLIKLQHVLRLPCKCVWGGEERLNTCTAGLSRQS